MTNVKCPNCGSPNVEQIDANRFQCPYCGTTFNAAPQQPAFQQQPVYQQPQQAYGPQQQQTVRYVNDNPGCLMNGLCFLVPIVGIILYFTKKEEMPNCAKSYLTWSLIGFALGVIVNLAS